MEGSADQGPLVAVRYAPPSPAPDGYPFGLPLVRSLTEIAFETPVTILVGENGTGKSTLLEALAAAADLPAISASEIAEDATLEPARRLADCLRLVWRRRTHRGFFLPAEDFCAFCKRLTVMRADLLRDAEEMNARFADRSTYARQLERTGTLSEAPVEPRDTPSARQLPYTALPSLGTDPASACL